MGWHIFTEANKTGKPMRVSPSKESVPAMCVCVFVRVCLSKKRRFYEYFRCVQMVSISRFNLVSSFVLESGFGMK